MGTRTFLAVDLDDAILDRMVGLQAQLDDGESKINWVSRDNIHLTLNFLGDVDDELIADVCNIAAAAAGEVEPFEIDVAGVVATPPHGAPRMFWAEAADATGRLGLLHGKLDAGLVGLRLRQEERAFKAHITLARIKFARDPARLRQLALQLAKQDFGVQHVEELVAYASQLTREGPVYTPISRAKLGK